MMASKITPPPSPRVVVVEDNPPTLRVLSDFLAQSGFDVGKARTVAEAKSTIDHAGCEAVLLDMHLPDATGHEFVRELRSHPDADVSHVVIVLLTASSLATDRDACLRAGADLFLTKPMPLREVSRLLKAYIRTRFPQMGA